jgi:hypothetical protein
MCDVCCVLCAVCCVLCDVCYVLCDVCCVLCAMCCVLCAMCYVLCACPPGKQWGRRHMRSMVCGQAGLRLAFPSFDPRSCTCCGAGAVPGHLQQTPHLVLEQQGRLGSEGGSVIHVRRVWVTEESGRDSLLAMGQTYVQQLLFGGKSQMASLPLNPCCTCFSASAVLSNMQKTPHC